MIDKGVRRQIGSQQLFCVEFEVHPNSDPNRPVNEWWGSLWLWVEGRCLGESQEIQKRSRLGLYVVNGARENGIGTSALFASYDQWQSTLDLVVWAVYMAMTIPSVTDWSGVVRACTHLKSSRQETHSSSTGKRFSSRKTRASDLYTVESVNLFWKPGGTWEQFNTVCVSCRGATRS